MPNSTETAVACDAGAIRVGGLTPLSSTDYPGYLAAVVFCQGCPWRCGYCHNPHLVPGTKEAAVAWDEVMAFLHKRQGLLDAVVFSGDKLLGGPQAGILLGTTRVIAACRSDPLAPALRADKFTLAALEATLMLYRDPETARREIPVLRMLTTDADELHRRADALARALPAVARAQVVEGASEVGGGSFPGAALRTWLVQLTPGALTASDLVTRLREADPPVIARIASNHVVLDPRTILPDQDAAIVRAAGAALDA